MLQSPAGRVGLSLLILTAAILLTFHGILHNDFVNFDDQSEIIENPDFNPVTLEKLSWNWTHTRLTLYMPVTYYAWGAIAAVAHRDSAGLLMPGAFHALNLSLHCVCSWLVFLLIRQLWKHTAPALIGALIFAVHPLQVEPVAWASGMYTLLSTALSLGAMIAYIRFAEEQKKRQTSNIQHPTPNIQREDNSCSSQCWMLSVGCWMFAFYFLATAFYLLALFTKAASVSLPLAAGAIDLLILGRPFRKVIRSLSLWVLIAIPMVFLAKHFQDVSAIALPPPWGRPIVALDAVGFYLRKVVAPGALIPDYGRNPAWVMQHLNAAMISTIAAMIVLIFAWRARRKSAWIAAGFAVFLAGIGPYLGLAAFDFQYVSTVADRYAYFGMVGVALLAAGACLRSKLMSGFLLIAIVAGAVMSHHQVARWHDSQSLFGYTLAVNPQSLLSHNVFGYLAARAGDDDAAEAHYKQALQIWPEDAEIHFDLGNLYFKHHPDMARQEYELAVKYQPHFVIYRNNLAASLARLNRPQEAYVQWRQAAIDDPDYVDPHNNLGDLFMNLDRRDDARRVYQAALRIDRLNPHALAKLKEIGG
jgi:Tfp pilus assembly protein PilF